MAEKSAEQMGKRMEKGPAKREAFSGVERSAKGAHEATKSVAHLAAKKLNGVMANQRKMENLVGYNQGDVAKNIAGYISEVTTGAKEAGAPT